MSTGNETSTTASTTKEEEERQTGSASAMDVGPTTEDVAGNTTHTASAPAEPMVTEPANHGAGGSAGGSGSDTVKAQRKTERLLEENTFDQVLYPFKDSIPTGATREQIVRTVMKHAQAMVSYLDPLEAKLNRALSALQTAQREKRKVVATFTPVMTGRTVVFYDEADLSPVLQQAEHDADAIQVALSINVITSSLERVCALKKAYARVVASPREATHTRSLQNLHVIFTDLLDKEDDDSVVVINLEVLVALQKWAPLMDCAIAASVRNAVVDSAAKPVGLVSTLFHLKKIEAFFMEGVLPLLGGNALGNDTDEKINNLHSLMRTMQLWIFIQFGRRVAECVNERYEDANMYGFAFSVLPSLKTLERMVDMYISEPAMPQPAHTGQTPFRVANLVELQWLVTAPPEFQRVGMMLFLSRAFLPVFLSFPGLCTPLPTPGGPVALSQGSLLPGSLASALHMQTLVPTPSGGNASAGVESNLATLISLTDNQLLLLGRHARVVAAMLESPIVEPPPVMQPYAVERELAAYVSDVKSKGDSTADYSKAAAEEEAKRADEEAQKALALANAAAAQAGRGDWYEEGTTFDELTLFKWLCDYDAACTKVGTRDDLRERRARLLLIWQKLTLQNLRPAHEGGLTSASRPRLAPSHAANAKEYTRIPESHALLLQFLKWLHKTQGGVVPPFQIVLQALNALVRQADATFTPTDKVRDEDALANRIFKAALDAASLGGDVEQVGADIFKPYAEQITDPVRTRIILLAAREQIKAVSHMESISGIHNLLKIKIPPHPFVIEALDTVKRLGYGTTGLFGDEGVSASSSAAADGGGSASGGGAAGGVRALDVEYRIPRRTNSGAAGGGAAPGAAGHSDPKRKEKRKERELDPLAMPMFKRPPSKGKEPK